MIAFNKDAYLGNGQDMYEKMGFQGKRNMVNIVCAIDKRNRTTWFAFNKKTGAFACMTGYRTMNNSAFKREYKQRYDLVLDYVKIDDEDVEDTERITFD